MGTGSFGGGSGSFGSGSSGGSSGLGSGSRRGPGGGRRRGDSVFKRILALIRFTDDVNEHPEKKKARDTVVAALRSAPRRRYLLEVLGNSLIDGVYRDLLELQALVAGGFDWARVAQRHDLNAERAFLRSLGVAIIERHRSPAIDERIVEIANTAARELLMAAVGDDPDLYFQVQRPRDLERRFDTKVLDSTASRFIAAILSEVVRRDVLRMSEEGRAMLGEVFLEIANRWCRVFEEKFRDGQKTRYRNLLAVIAREFASFQVSE